MIPHLYRAYEFLIRSEIAIPGAIPLDDAASGEVDIEIAFGEAGLPDTARSEGPYRYVEGRLLFDMPAIAYYLCEGGRRITIEKRPGASERDIAGLLIATALPALLWMRGEIVLHAAGLVPAGGDRAIAICGASRSGKSTVLRDMLGRGSRVVGDDSLRVRFSPAGVTASGLPCRFFWSREGEAERPDHAVAAERVLAAMPLAAVFILDWPRGEPHFERVAAVDALRQLLLQRHRPRVPRLLGMEGRFLAGFATLSRLDVYLWKRRDGAIALSSEEFAFLTRKACITSSKNME